MKTPVLFLTLFALQTSGLEASSEMKDLFSMSLEELMNVEIYSAGKSYEKIKDIPASVYIVTRDDIEKYGYTTLTEIIENIPGVYNIYNYNGTSGNFGVRGFWNPKSQNSSIAILINGVSQLVVSDNDRSYPLERISVSPENIDRIEFIKGPMGVIYGNGASFGAINIITNEQDKNFITASSGSTKTSKVTGRYFKELKKGELVVNASAYQTDGLNNKFSDMMGAQGEAVLTNTGVAVPAADATTRDLLENENNYVNISGSYGEWYFDISNNHSEVEAFYLVPSVEDGDRRFVDVFNTTLGVKNKVNNWINLDTRLSINDYDYRRDFDGITPGLIAESNKHYNSYELELLSTFTPNNQLNIIAGININKTDDYFEFTNAPAQSLDNEVVVFDRTVQALFTQVTYKYNEKFSIIAGLRSEHLKRYNRTFFDNFGTGSESTNSTVRPGRHNQSPRLSAIYSFNEKSMLKLMYGKTIRYSDDRYLPEETETYEINYLLTKNDFYASLSLFNNQLDNLLTDVLFLSGAVIDNQVSNSGEISTTGIEVILKKEFTDDLESEIGFTVQKSTDKSSNIHVDASYSPDTLIHFKTSYTNKNITYAIQGQFIDSILPFLNRTNADPQGTYIGDKIDAYMVWNFNVRIDTLNSDMHASINIHNIFDEKIRYANNLENTEFLAKGSIGEDRTIMATIGWKF